jgi:hypothetical protein
MTLRLCFFLWPFLLQNLATCETLANRLIRTVGSKEQLFLELDKISVHASTLRNGTKSVIELGGEGATGLVSRIKFTDGITWAAKVSEARFHSHMQRGIASIQAVERYCPSVPVAKVHTQVEPLANHTLYYYLTDWIDGHTLGEDPEYRETYVGLSTSEVAIPQKVLIQLAEFVYNVTTCPIPIVACMETSVLILTLYSGAIGRTTLASG